jgi:hypothetical protein
MDLKHQILVLCPTNPEEALAIHLKEIDANMRANIPKCILLRSAPA